MYQPRDTPRQRQVRDLTRLVQQLGLESQRTGHAFAQQQQLHATDLEALLHVMQAEGVGAPLTLGQLSAELGLSSGATTSVVDRLERQGHVRRDRDSADRRRVHLRYGAAGQRVAMEFFGPLGRRTDGVMEQFSDDDLAVVRRFLTGMVGAIVDHRVEIGVVESD